MPLPSSTGAEAREQCNIRVRDQIVANAAVTAIADVPLGEQILRIEIPFRPIGRSGLAQAPQALQRELGIAINNRLDGLVELLLRHMPLVDERHLLTVESWDRTGCL